MQARPVGVVILHEDFLAVQWGGFSLVDAVVGFSFKTTMLTLARACYKARAPLS